MRLSRLEIFGFKSFAKKLDLKMTGGITSIVGPNGCGKTNVVDAIRWVLGEQRPSMIRLERMEDVLFKGSTTRRQLGMSEVSLTMDNESGRLPLNMPEVTITRRLYRSGESDYLINKKPCRLSDINDLLMDTGMGTDSYSLFEQSMINSILSNKTEDRRHIFEEAAGVTKYKARRKSAINKLVGIEDDLNRVGDIVTELERRTDSLRRQAQRARRYRTFKSEIRQRMLGVSAFEIERLSGRLADVDRELATVRASLEGAKVAVSAKTAEIESLSLDILSVEREVTDTATRFNESMAAINEKEKELARLDSRLESLREMAARARESAARNSASLEKLADNHGATAGELETVSGRLTELDETFDERNERYRMLQSMVTEKMESRTEIEEDFRQLEHKLSFARMALERIQVMRESSHARLDEIAVRTRELGETAETLGLELEAHRAVKSAAIERESALTDSLQELKHTLETHVATRDELDERIRELRDTHATLKAERDFLDEVIRSCEGYSGGVKAAVSAVSLNGRVHGVLADIISAEERYVPAVQAALDGYLHHVLVDDIAAAYDGAREISGLNAGRVAMLGIGSSEYQEEPVTGDGIMGPLVEFVRTDTRYKPIVTRLLSRVYLVKTLEHAIALHEDLPGHTFVTLAGEIVGRFGDVHAGTVSDDDTQTIGRMERLETLNVSVNAVDADLAVLQGNRSELDALMTTARAAIAETEQALAAEHRSREAAASGEAQVAARLDAVRDSLAALQEEERRIAETTGSLDADERASREAIERDEALFVRTREELAVADSGLREFRADLEQRRAAVNELAVERAALKEKRSSLTRELAAITERREALAQTSRRTLGEIEQAEQESLELGVTKQRLVAELKERGQAHEQCRLEKDELDRRYAELRADRSDRERGMQETRRVRDELMRRESSLGLNREEALMKLNNIYERIADDYGLEKDEIPAFEHDGAFDPAEERLAIDDLRRKMHALGDVNLAAEEDYEAEKERLDFLKSERDDLVEAGNTLKDTIGRINQIARSRFVEAFEQIRVNFKQMFHEFFSGGECDLALEEDRDPLEADILITARPPGKKVRSINLLSSGERALTAISLLFAIYMVKPSPFCILDEVDAPLDDANLRRYLKVIRKFSQRTQFIMVTHNKSTMAEADNLYGITMEEPGLSTLVSVRLSEVDVDDDSGVGEEVDLATQ